MAQDSFSIWRAGRNRPKFLSDTLLLNENARDDEFQLKNMTYRSVFKPGLFAGRTVIVTGGGSGIGRCAAHELTSLGASVALVGRNPEKLEKVREEIKFSLRPDTDLPHCSQVHYFDERL
jgi:predicted Rossmann-fold nucleotide-binding protein